jgi:hypothetical protein
MSITITDQPPCTRVDVAVDASLSVDARQRRRENNYLLHAVYNLNSSIASGQNCSRSRRGGNSGVTLRKTHTNKGVRASWSQQTCGSMFCPYHSPIKAFKERTKLSMATEQHVADGGETLFLTLTARTEFSRTPQFKSAEYAFRHDAEAFSAFRELDKGLPRIGAQKRLLAAAEAYGAYKSIPMRSHEDWELNRRMNTFIKAKSSALFSGKSWKKDEINFGIKGRVDALELVPTPAITKDGERDWNYVAHNLHIHAVLFLHRPLNNADREELTRRLRTRWLNRLRKEGFYATADAQDFKWIAATDVQKVTNYITKFSDEVMFGKQPEHESSVSIWDALRESGGGRFDADGTMLAGDPAAKNWFRQVEQVFHGRKKFNTSEQFYKRMGVDALMAEITEDFKRSSIMQSVLTFTGGTWQLLAEDNPEYKFELLNMAENTSDENLYAFIEEQGYSFAKPEILSLDDIADDDVQEVAVDDELVPF